MKETIHGFKLVEMTDHEFAAWLRKLDPNWDYVAYKEGGTPCTHFRAYGKTVAVVFYNNQKCTRKIYIKKDL